MLIYSMSVSIDGFVNDRDGDIGWSPPGDEQFACSLAEVSGLGCYLLGRRLYELMRIWETDPSIRINADREAFAAAWCALPKVVFSHTLERVEGNARLATGSVAEEIAAALAATDRDVSIGGPNLAAQAIELDLLDELRLFRAPVVLGAGLPYLPPLGERREHELIDTRTFASRVVYERYRRVR